MTILRRAVVYVMGAVIVASFLGLCAIYGNAGEHETFGSIMLGSMLLSYVGVWIWSVIFLKLEPDLTRTALIFLLLFTILLFFVASAMD